MRRRIIGDDIDVGLFFDPQKEQGRPLVRAHVRRWRDVIDENKRRLEFMTNALEHDPSIADGLQYVRDEYSDLLPEDLREPASAGGQAEELFLASIFHDGPVRGLSAPVASMLV